MKPEDVRLGGLYANGRGYTRRVLKFEKMRDVSGPWGTRVDWETVAATLPRDIGKKGRCFLTTFASWAKEEVPDGPSVNETWLLAQVLLEKDPERTFAGIIDGRNVIVAVQHKDDRTDLVAFFEDGTGKRYENARVMGRETQLPSNQTLIIEKAGAHADKI